MSGSQASLSLSSLLSINTEKLTSAQGKFQSEFLKTDSDTSFREVMSDQNKASTGVSDSSHARHSERERQQDRQEEKERERQQDQVRASDNQAADDEPLGRKGQSASVKDEAGSDNRESREPESNENGSEDGKTSAAGTEGRNGHGESTESTKEEDDSAHNDLDNIAEYAVDPLQQALEGPLSASALGLTKDSLSQTGLSNDVDPLTPHERLNELQLDGVDALGNIELEAQSTALHGVGVSGLVTSKATAVSGKPGLQLGKLIGPASLEDALKAQLAKEPESPLTQEVKNPSLSKESLFPGQMASPLLTQSPTSTVMSQLMSQLSVTSETPSEIEGLSLKESASPLQQSLAVGRISQPALSQYQMADARTALLQTNVTTAVGQPQWGSAVGERVLWLAAQNITSAEIHLDPPELGPLQVKVSVNQDQASVSFTSQHQAVREALDQNAFRLRELFDGQGVDLVNVDVSDQSLAQQSQTDEDDQQGRSVTGDAESEEVGAEEVIQTATLGLVDHFV